MDRANDGKRWFFVFFPCVLQAILVGNPADPGLQKDGLVTPKDSWVSLRLGVFEDYVYQQKYKDEFTIQGSDPSNTFVRLHSTAGLATLNFDSRIEFYGIAGESTFELNKEIYSNPALCWGIGGKLIIFETQNLFISVDAKYFTTKQRPEYFLSEQLPFEVVGDFHFHLSETQFALGMAYLHSYLSPYVCLTYLISKIDPNPMVALVRWPMDASILIDAQCKSVLGKRRWGLTLGGTLLSGSKATLAVESRMFNQNAIDIKLDLRF